ncbi:hypothetical protein ACO2KH_06300 [Leptospira terpstrae]|uniref:hypothetical protein n=1 Tax=Leptospira terpstrae TaxID=293075 RepID=UPI003CFD4A2C
MRQRQTAIRIKESDSMLLFCTIKGKLLVHGKLLNPIAVADATRASDPASANISLHILPIVHFTSAWQIPSAPKIPTSILDYLR